MPLLQPSHKSSLHVGDNCKWVMHVTNYPELQVDILCKGRNIVFPTTDVSINSSLMCEDPLSEFEAIST